MAAEARDDDLASSELPRRGDIIDARDKRSSSVEVNIQLADITDGFIT